MNFRHRIGSNPSCSDPRYWSFERNSGLPRDAFEPRRRVDPDVVVLVVCCGILCGLLALLIGGWLA